MYSGREKSSFPTKCLPWIQTLWPRVMNLCFCLKKTKHFLEGKGEKRRKVTYRLVSKVLLISWVICELDFVEIVCLVFWVF